MDVGLIRRLQSRVTSQGEQCLRKRVALDRLVFVVVVVVRLLVCVFEAFDG